MSDFQMDEGPRDLEILDCGRFVDRQTSRERKRFIYKDKFLPRDKQINQPWLVN